MVECRCIRLCSLPGHKQGIICFKTCFLLLHMGKLLSNGSSLEVTLSSPEQSNNGELNVTSREVPLD